MEGVDAAMADDVKQQLRRGLLVGDAGRPGILEFSGRGELRRWLRVLAVRWAVALRRRARREMPSEDWLLERALVPAEHPEMAYLKSFYRREVADAIGQALLALSAHERTLLRQSFVDGLSIDALAALHGIHRATAARWLARAQKALSKETRALLTRRLKVQPAELRSILDLIRSGLQLSLRVLFAGRRRRRTRAIARELASS
jgi:RNA polymerase sigma-70 factor, ECF subfamily